MKTQKVLIVAGLGDLRTYLAAAAVALRRHPGAEVAFASRQALPDVLESRAGEGFSLALLLGMGLTAEPGRLAKGFGAMARAGTRVVWYSAAGFPVPEGVPAAARRLFEARVAERADLVGWVAEDLGVDAGDLPGGGKGASGKAWDERFEAAGWSFANSRDLTPLEGIVRDLAGRVGPEGWEEEARRLVEAWRAFGYRRLVTNSPAMRRLRKDIARVAGSRAMRVLVTGESGVGKETVAQQLHVQSGRRGPFLAFNCATVAQGLVESRLFGHAKGAFTGAAGASPGLFREADGGTLFLDEIGELPGEVQGTLLRALQEGRVMGVGETRETKVDVRVVAATNRDLAGLVREGKFREDLYWRLAVVELAVPPLRERKEDFRPLARELWRSLAPGRRALSEAELAALEGWDWPGNVRELSNVLERAALFEGRGIEELLAEERARGGRVSGGAAAAPGEDAPLEAVVRAHVRGVWERHGRNVAEAARVLGISRNTVRAKLGA